MSDKRFLPTLALSLLLAACENSQHGHAASAAPAPAPVATQQTGSAPKPASPECTEVFIGNNSMVYDKSELTINKSKCKEFTVIVRNIGHMPRHSRGHNFVIAKDSDEKNILAEGVSFGAKYDFLKPDDHRIIAYTQLAGGGEERSMTFPTDRFVSGQTYVYFCSFLGHRKMRGKVNIIE